MIIALSGSKSRLLRVNWGDGRESIVRQEDHPCLFVCST
jgi:hypothetical protein